MTPKPPEINHLVELLLQQGGPPAGEGWLRMGDLSAQMGRAGRPFGRSTVRRRLLKLGDQVEHRIFGGYYYYRLRNGTKPK